MQKNRIKYLAEAARITADIFQAISKKIRPGVRESEIAGEIKSVVREKGLKCSFKTIVASGPNAAKPHAEVTDRMIGTDDMVVLDFGVVYRGFCSDMTRTIVIGKIDPFMRRLYACVKEAKRLAVKKARPGLRISDFVGEVHGYIRKKGFGGYILHTLGHGLGRRIHEGPKLSEKNRRFLKKNMVITIEPGLYVEKKGGVRIEDVYILTGKGARLLSR